MLKVSGMEPGEAFGKYQLLAPIASGGMAEVWLARSSSIGGFEKRLAIKRMKPEYSGSAQFVSMFIDEAKLTVALSHPNIVQVFDFGRVDDDYFMAMEFVDGVDLALLARRLRKTCRALPVSMALRIMHDVFAGLAHAHSLQTSVTSERGIIHRDVSPQNVLVSFEGHVKVSDFGIARAATSCDRSETGWVLGKLAYASPEQLAGANLDVRTDLWSAGVILHELLTNKRLFARTDDDDTREAVEFAPILPPSRSNAEVPSEIDEIVLGLLTRDRNARLSDARAAAEALGGILGRRFPDASAFRLKEIVSAAWNDRVPRIQPSTTLDTSLAAAVGPTHRVAEGATYTLGEPGNVRESEDEGDRRGAHKGVHPRRQQSEQESGLESRLESGLESEHRNQPSRDPENERARDPEIDRLRAQFQRIPSLWTLVDLGRRHRDLGNLRAYTTWLKVAAAKFAQHGYLVQATTIYRELLDEAAKHDASDETQGSDKTQGSERAQASAKRHAADGARPTDPSELESEIKRLRVLAGLPHEALWDALGGGADTEELTRCRALLEPDRGEEARGAEQRVADAPRVFNPSPIVGTLDADALVAFVNAITLRRFDTGQTIIKEGAPGTALYIVGRGRVVVSTGDFLGRRTFLTSLSDGDCFGEQSFFSNEPRTATVEAFEPVTLIEITQQALGGLLSRYPAIEASLQQFYKERVAQNILLKSQVFGHLSTRARQDFARRFSFRTCAPGEVVVKEGEIGDEFYAIKRGEMLVTTHRTPAPATGDGAEMIVLAHLKAGDIFGEAAAIDGSPRTATVRATTESELLCMSGAELGALLDQNSEVRDLLGAKIAARNDQRRRAVGVQDQHRDRE
ncbi:MAG: cyclic nucleotide-binding domain-containing protein [Deltaproteobacteria bacterium]|nr:cyclic nucleotide-binding domain-containing protein [Deltaproteobacteria bacterium]